MGQRAQAPLTHSSKASFRPKLIATQAYPQNEDTIVAAQQAIKPIHTPSMRRKGGVKWMPTVKEGVGAVKLKKGIGKIMIVVSVSHGGTPCVVGGT
jgi:chitin synthase